MVHSDSGWTRGVQVKLWDLLRTHAIPERLRGAFTTRRYTNPRLPLPLPLFLTITITVTPINIISKEFTLRVMPEWEMPEFHLSVTVESCYYAIAISNKIIRISFWSESRGRHFCAVAAISQNWPLRPAELRNG